MLEALKLEADGQQVPDLSRRAVEDNASGVSKYSEAGP